MPPSFQTEGIDAAKEVRKRNTGTGVVILSQYDDPNYAISLLSEGAEGYAYLLKDRVAEGDQLGPGHPRGGRRRQQARPQDRRRADRAGHDRQRAQHRGGGVAAAGGRGPARSSASPPPSRPRRPTRPASIERLFLKLAQGASTGAGGALQRLKMLHQAIVDLDEQGETMSRLLPGGRGREARREGRRMGETEKLTVTVLMSDIRGYSTIAEQTDPSLLAGQLNIHRIEMNRAISAAGGNVWQFVGDAVMAVFGAPLPQEDHADRSLTRRNGYARRPAGRSTARWVAEGLAPFEIGIGLSTGDVAAALLGSDEHLEYSLVGDTVNLAQRLQQWADPGQIGACRRQPIEVWHHPSRQNNCRPRRSRGEARRFGLTSFQGTVLEVTIEWIEITEGSEAGGRRLADVPSRRLRRRRFRPPGTHDPGGLLSR